ncbi:ATP-binding protein [Brevibacillus fulvus]|uniref:histidine kinase n=1 Tax=Brevibacillus fulvus TaxID=1125967 RepID=A0A938Y162_9BACL|nr:two-component system CitB family sensor kinase [Brevibacillus fulvus]
MRFQSKLILLFGVLLLLVIVLLGLSYEYMLANTLRQEIGNRALSVAKTVASMPEIKEAFADPQPSRIIAPLAETIRVETNAEFVTIGNRQGIRYSHPVPERIGQEMQGGDDQEVFEGHSIISEAVGSLGPSLRGKAPIFNDQKQVIGVVSVGFLIKDIQQTITSYRNKIIVLVLVSLSLGIVGTVLIARSVKKAILGLEPAEIGQLYREKQAILQSIREGILAVNAQGFITLANQPAIQMMGLNSQQDITGMHISKFHLLEVLRSQQPVFDEEVTIGGNVLVVNRVPILDEQNRVIGAVASFRDKTELYRVTEELSRIKDYADALRAQTHEYSNKLYLISGLLQLESYQEAIDFISTETDLHLNHTRFIMREVPDPIIAGLLIGKLNQAQELGVKLELDEESSFRQIPAAIDRRQLVTIMGNLIDNAMEAVLAPGAHARHVKVLLMDIGEDLLIEVEDRGAGIPPEHAEAIFQTGFSTKAEGTRGYGLALVKQAVDHLGGYITFSDHPLGGTMFTVSLPKQADQNKGR